MALADDLRDAGLIASIQRLKHYEIAAYGTAAALAGQLELRDDQDVLLESLEEEKLTDVELTALAEECLSHLGGVVRVSEAYMDAVTAVSGSGPAYFALLAEAMIEAGLLLGLSREVTTRLVVQTMLGTAKLLRDEHMHPVELREMVTSPGGTTIRAIRELERAGVRAAFLNAIQAAMERSQELATGGS